MSAPEYRDNDPGGWCGDARRGAAMGRNDQHAAGGAAPRLYLRLVPLCGDYDRLGTYWGAGDPLYWYADAGGDIDAVIRASDRKAAKGLIRARYQAATFFR